MTAPPRTAVRVGDLRRGVSESIGLLGRALRGDLRTVPIGSVTDEFAFSFGPSGWNYLRALAESVSDGRRATISAAQYESFFRHPRINAVRFLEDLLFLHDPQRRALHGADGHYLGTYPWGGLTLRRPGGVPFGWYHDEREGTSTRDLWGYGKNLWYRPSDEYTIEAERRRAAHRCETLRNGYRPWRHLSLPSVAILERVDGERRAVVADGHHRLARLGLMGHADLSVVVTRVVRESDVDEWYYVRRRNCTVQRALSIFDAFFTLDGSERFAALGLPT